MNKTYAYKTFSAIALCLAFFILGACHKNKPNPIPGPAPIFDSTAYKDSVAHAQQVLDSLLLVHQQDSVKHYNDSVTHYLDSLHTRDSIGRYYFNSIRSTYHWTGAYYVQPLSTPQYGPYVQDTTLTLDYAGPDTSHLSIKIGNTVFPQGNITVTVFGDRVIFEARRTIDYSRDTDYVLTHYFATDSISYNYWFRSGAVGQIGLLLKTKK